MRHQRKRHRLSRPQDQRKALLRSLATSLFIHNEIQTTLAKAKALKDYSEKIITLAKRGDLHARRQVLKFIYDLETGKDLCINCNKIDDKSECSDEEKKIVKETVLRKLFTSIGSKYADRNGGYTRIYKLPPRRGDGAPMAIIQLV